MNRRYLSVLVVCLAVCGSASAQRTWTGSQSGNWSVAANWSPAGIPVAGEQLIFPAGAAHQTMTNDLPADFNVGDLSFRDSYVLDGNELTLLGGLFVNVGGNAQHIKTALKLASSSDFIISPLSSVDGAVDVNGQTLVFDSFITNMNGPINGSGSIKVVQGGSLTITSSGNFSGNIDGFAVLLGASLPNATFSPLVTHSIALNGNGTIGAVTIPAAESGGNPSILRPGQDCCGYVLAGGVLHTKSLTMAGSYIIDLFPGALSDSVQVTGSVTLSGTLQVSLPSGAPVPGQTFTIMDNDGNDPVNGMFAGLPEGAAVSAGSAELVISYHGGDGNDVVLTAVTAIKRWNGSQSGNWSTAANWSPAAIPVAGEQLIFPAGAGHQTMTNDLPTDFSVGDLSFQDSYVLGGNELTLLGNLFVPGNTQHINTPLKLGADSHFNVNDPASLNGAVDVNGHSLVLDSFITNMNGPVNGTGSISMTAGNSVTITSSGNFSGNVDGFAVLLGGSLPNATFSRVSASWIELAGNGTAGAVTIPAASPGGSPSILRPGQDCCGHVVGGGVLHTKSLTMAGSYIVRLIPGALSDSVQVTGSVTLSGSLEILIPSGTLNVGDSFTIIDNDGTDAVNGTFVGFPESSVVTLNGYPIRITYRGGDGNDVVLAVVADTSAVLTQTTNTTTVGESWTMTDTVSSALGTPTGSVQFVADGVLLGTAPLVNGVASLTSALPIAGGHTVYAYFHGTGAFADDRSNGISHIVTRGQSRTAISSDSVNTRYGQVVHFTIALGAQPPASGLPEGSVTVFADGVPLGIAPVFGPSANFETAALHAGLHSITATYNGDVDFFPSTSAAIQQNVSKAQTAIDVRLRTTIFAGESPFITVFVNSTPKSALVPSGSVTVSEGGVVLATEALNGGVTTFALLPLAVGEHSLVLNYSGEADFEPSSTSIIQSVVVPSVSIHGARVVEGNSGVTSVSLVTALSAPLSQPVRVSFSTLAGTATEGEDYERVSGVLEFAPGELTRSIELHVIGDTFPEADETFSVLLSNAVNATIDTPSAVIVIANDDQVPPRHRPSRH